MWKLTFTELEMVFTFETEDGAHAFVRIVTEVYGDNDMEPYTLEEMDEA